VDVVLSYLKNLGEKMVHLSSRSTLLQIREIAESGKEIGGIDIDFYEHSHREEIGARGKEVVLKQNYSQT
jgi:hypothetical protein